MKLSYNYLESSKHGTIFGFGLTNPKVDDKRSLSYTLMVKYRTSDLKDGSNLTGKLGYIGLPYKLMVAKATF